MAHSRSVVAATLRVAATTSLEEGKYYHPFDMTVRNDHFSLARDVIDRVLQLG